MSFAQPPYQGPSTPPPGQPYTPAQPPAAGYPQPGQPPARRRRSRAPLFALIGVVILIVLLVAGTVITDAVIGAPKFRYQDQDVTINGGQAVITGQAKNQGAGEAQQVIVNVNVKIGSGLKGQAAFAKVAAGASVPYKITIDLGNAPQPSRVVYDVATDWADPDLDLANKNYKQSTKSGHLIDEETGSVHNAGKADAPNTVVTFTATPGSASTPVITTVKQNVGTVPAGGDVAYKVDLDLGTNPPHDYYVHWQEDYDAAKMSTTDDQASFVGGTATLAGTVLNSGPAPSQNVKVDRKFMDSNGNLVVAGSTVLDKIAAHGTQDYKITIDLGSASYSTVDKDQIVISWIETHYFLLKSSRTLTGKA